MPQINVPQSKAAIKEVANAAYSIDLLAARLQSIEQSINNGFIDIQTAIDNSTPESGLLNISSVDINDLLAGVSQLRSNYQQVILKLAALR
jgi:hypothetical protein